MSRKLSNRKFGNAKIISWMLEMLDISIGILMRGFKAAMEMWKYPKERKVQQSNLAFQIEHDNLCDNRGEEYCQRTMLAL